jgi:hypothetical protein
MAFRRFKVQITGTSPILFANGKAVDVLSSEAIALKWFTDQKQKKNERAMRRLFWLFSAYWGTEGTFDYGEDLKGDSSFEGYSGPMIPAENMQRCIRDAAADWKKGKEIGRAVAVENDAKIVYEGPKDAVEMFSDGRYYHAKRNKRGTTAVRMILPSWQVEYSLLLNDEISNLTMLTMVLDRAGMATGLGTWRPGSPVPGRFGRFVVSDMTEVKADV